MQRTFYPFALLVFLFSGCSLQQKQIEEKIEIADVGFQTPESVEYYAKEDVYLVTNINGSPLAKDGNGFISKVSPDGRVINLKWIDGTQKGISLDAPKGAEILGDQLFVTDLKNIRIFDLSSGKLTKSIHIEQSTFLNGITVADRESVYVTDSGLKEGFKPSGSDAIYQVWKSGKVERLFASPDLGRPNGILDMGEDIYIVTFGSGEMFKLNMTGDKVMLPQAPKAGLDGFVKLDKKRLLISSWNASAIYLYQPKKGYQIFAEGLDAPADMGLDTKRKKVLVPLFKQNKVICLPY
jgi:hypothetical protein